jgi:GTPase-associated protein 1, N-terminal domain type 2
MSDSEAEEGGALLVPHMLFGTFRRESTGYRTVCRSPGVSEAMAKGAQRHCEGWGSCVESGFTTAVVHQVLTAGERDGEKRLYLLAIRVTNLGTDHKGRQGALCFHIAFFDEESYRRVGFEPFLLDRSGALVGDWDGRDAWPPLVVDPATLPAPPARCADPKLLPVLRDHLLHVLAGHSLRFAGRLPSPASDEHVALLFRLLPWASRRRMATATFTFSARRDYALAVEYSEGGRVDPLRPQPLPSLPRDLPAAVTAYVDEVIGALTLHDTDRVQALARTANPHAVLPPPAAPQDRRSVLGRLFGR